MPPRIDHSQCVGCGICIFQCGVDVFAYDAEREQSVVARARACVDCYICEITCPVHAIQVKVGVRYREVVEFEKVWLGGQHDR